MKAGSESRRLAGPPSMQLAAFRFVEIDDLQGTPDRCECEDDHPCTEKGDEHEDFRDSCSRGNQQRTIF